MESFEVLLIDLLSEFKSIKELADDADIDEDAILVFFLSFWSFKYLFNK